MDARTIAERLGLSEEAVRALQRRGFLQRLDLDGAEIRVRLWQGHLRSGLTARSPRPRGSEITLDRRNWQ
jgi:hypothetical protein